MTNSITPPSELVKQWEIDATLNRKAQRGSQWVASLWTTAFAAEAAQWGADQELEACCEWLAKPEVALTGKGPGDLRATRRPKPPSLKEQALKQLRDMDQAGALDCNIDKIRAALEALPND